MQAEGCLDKDAAFLYEIINAMDDMVRVISTQRQVLLANDKMRSVLKEGEHCYSPFSDTPCANCVSCEAIDSGRVCRKRVELGERVYSVTASPARDERGNVFAVEAWRDISSEDRLDKELMENTLRIKRELSYARRVQWNLLPHSLPQPEGYFIDAAYRPWEELSGDYYDVFLADEDTVMFTIADVSGHGVTAAMLTVFYGRLIRSECGSDIPCSEVLASIEKRFCDMRFENQLYITAVLGKLKLSTSKVELCSAGHAAPPLLMRQDSDRYITAPALPICRWPGRRDRRDITFTLERGDILLLATDGVEDLLEGDDILVRVRELIGQNTKKRLIPSLMRGSLDNARRDDAAVLQIYREELG